MSDKQPYLPCNYFFLLLAMLIIRSEAAKLPWNIYTHPRSRNLSGSAYGKGRYVVTGEQGTILTSTDSTTWSSIFIGSENLTGTVFAKDLFVTVGDSGANYTSSDGTEWKKATSGTEKKLTSVTYGDGIFMAVGDSGTILTSSDGSIWEQQKITFTSEYTFVSYLNNRFFRVRKKYYMDWSDDGATWNTCQLSRSGNDIGSICYGNGAYIMCSKDNIFYSSDGETWTDTFKVNNSATTLTSAAFGNDTFRVVTGNNNSQTNYYSSDGINWQKQSLPYTCGNIAYQNNHFIAVGEDGHITFRSGPVWTRNNDGNALTFHDICYGAGLFVAVGEQLGEVLYSKDGQSWDAAPLAANLRSITYGNGRFITSGKQGVLYTSTDGKEWTACDPGTGLNLYDVCSSDNGYAAVGDSGTIIFSSDGVTWETRHTDTDTMRSITYGDGRYVAISTSKTLTSTDAVTWTAGTQTANRMMYVHFGLGHFIGFDNSGTIHTSIDGIAWKPRSKEINHDMYGAVARENIFVSCGQAGMVRYSTDLVDWSYELTSGAKWLYGIAYHDDRYVMVGEDGTIFYSDPEHLAVCQPVIKRTLSISHDNFAKLLHGQLKVRLNDRNVNGRCVCRIFSLSGKIIWETTGTITSGSTSLPSAKLAPGRYLVKLLSDAGNEHTLLLLVIPQ